MRDSAETTTRVCCCAFDIGTRNFAYSIVSCDKIRAPGDRDSNHEDNDEGETINNWQLHKITSIDLHPKKILRCCANQKGKPHKRCTHKATYSYTYPFDDVQQTEYFCKVHKVVTKTYWSDADTKSLFIAPKSGNVFDRPCCKCSSAKGNSEAQVEASDDDDSDTEEIESKWKIYSYEQEAFVYYCTKHKGSELSRLKNLYKLKPLKKKKEKRDTKDSILALLKKLTQVEDDIREYQVTHIAIENQKSVNLVMRSIASFIYSYFLIRGHEHNLRNSNRHELSIPVSNVMYVLADCKLKLDGATFPKSVKKITDSSKRYKKMKARSVSYVRYLLGYELSEADLADKVLQRELREIEADCSYADDLDEEKEFDFTDDETDSYLLARYAILFKI